MTEPHDAPVSAGGSSAAGPQTPAAAGYRQIAIGLAGSVVLVIALVATLVATGPLWAPLLPWAAGSGPAPDTHTGRPDAAQQQGQQQSPQEEVAANAALQGIERRVGALEARPTAPAGDIAEIRQEVARLAGTAADLATRIEAIDKEVHSQSAGVPTEIALVLALLQIRDAVEAGRPFAAAYEALAALARTCPEIAAAAAPLAEPAKSGLAGRAVLATRLRELAGAIATANTPANSPANPDAAAPDWTDQAWRRLRGLVTIRRIDGAGQGQQGDGPAAAVNAALLALAGGDLEAAVGALDTLVGAPAEAARPWLRMARERLAVEAALQRIEALLIARLGTPANAPAGAGPPR